MPGKNKKAPFENLELKKEWEQEEQYFVGSI